MVNFFFQAEDGIRDGTVTGVQTCALPICFRKVVEQIHARAEGAGIPLPRNPTACRSKREEKHSTFARNIEHRGSCCLFQIGRASCREGVETSAVVVSQKK